MVPSLFLAHGSPMLAIENNDYTRFLKQLGEYIKPKAIVIFTAHWESDILTISDVDGVYETIYDFYGFPDELYAIKYPAKGSAQYVSLLEKRFTDQGILVRKDTERGLDHGSWTLLSRMYPQADIPVVQVSVNPYLSAEDQYKIGQSLQGLGQEDILVIGSGVTVHYLRMVNWGQKTPEPWAVAFDDWLIEKMQNKDWDGLFHYETAPNARLAVPRPEHFVPFFIAMGAGGPNTDAKVIHRSYDLGTLSYLCMQF
ncbi:class III extradiol ring-cleavage dioxygenase [Aneurinibacillus sp. Ricciae_BoGa-3]|uniref:DODA-type extradiol aromatic ring-opening family dioxygenase n=1 Tax=Aneurinibacillus sp. Ricciae_BoGa-3 TaxID=3022697 RepID=UPI002341BA76|nr:class III extradiol ring-cleavage dioxygenase [Aneurinibacillus sp. Ricciae_BoGa-3]WCK53564.1 class III extradiol ring-cleavage dioxygenase [Aneurinibacillus sp. Ricciae_BoGa-3]